MKKETEQHPNNRIGGRERTRERGGQLTQPEILPLHRGVPGHGVVVQPAREAVEAREQRAEEVELVASVAVEDEVADAEDGVDGQVWGGEVAGLAAVEEDHEEGGAAVADGLHEGAHGWVR